MTKLLPFLVLMTLQQLAFSRTTSIDSVKVSVEDMRIVNKIVALYDGCMQENDTLRRLMDTCAVSYEVARKGNQDATNTILKLKTALAEDSVAIADQKKIVLNKDKILSDYKKLSTRRIIGCTVGGFVVGFTVPLILYLLKK